MKKIIFLVIIFHAIEAKSQIRFEKVFSDTNAVVIQPQMSVLRYGKSAIQTIDGGYMLLGTSNSYLKSDVYLIKLDSIGNSQWSKVYTLSGHSTPNSLYQMPNGDYVIGGTDDIGGGKGFLLKIDSLGSILWCKNYYSNYMGIDEVKPTFDGGYILTGFVIDSLYIITDALLIKTDVNGDTLWTKTFGGTHSDRLSSVQQTSDSGYVAFGVYEPTINGRGMVVKLNSNGDTLWTRVIQTPHSEIFYGTQTADNGYVMNAYDTLPYLLKLDANGNFNWAKSYNTFGMWYFIPEPDTGFTITGLTQYAGINNSFLCKMDMSGVMNWIKVYGISPTNNDWGLNVSKTNDNGYVVSGNYLTGSSANDAGAYIIKADSNGSTGCGSLTIPIIDNAVTIPLGSGVPITDIKIYVTSNNPTVTNLVLDSVVLCSLTGLSSLINLPHITFSPNPFHESSFLQIENPFFEKYTLDIFDPIGR